MKLSDRGITRRGAVLARVFFGAWGVFAMCFFFSCTEGVSNLGGPGQPCLEFERCNQGYECIKDKCYQEGLNCLERDGICPGETEFCSDDGNCVDDCDGRSCGQSPKAFQCGTCAGLTEYCTDKGQCEDDCLGRECGKSPNAGYICGNCSGDTDYCTSQGQCEDDCVERACGESPRAGHDCGTCSGSNEICADGQCECEFFECGDLCCEAGKFCGPNGTCSPVVKLVASDGERDDEFGFSVSIDSDVAIIGSRYEDQMGNNAGAAYIFQREAAGWVEVEKLTASDGEAEDEFGYSVSIRGDFIIVGAKGEDEKGLDAGAAYVFQKNAQGWQEVKKLTASDGVGGANFGWSVSINGDSAFVGAYKADTEECGGLLGVCDGAVYICHRDSGEWNEAQRISAGPESSAYSFGKSLSVRGDKMIVGASWGYMSDRLESAGAAYMFHREGTDWIRSQELFAADRGSFTYFGGSVSTSGDYTFVSATGESTAGSDYGSVYVFHKGVVEWEQIKRLRPTYDPRGADFGCSVSISGEFAVIGACLLHSEYPPDETGVVYLLHNGTEGWASVSSLAAPDGESLDRFGQAIDINGSNVIVGARWKDETDIDTGAAYIFELSD